MLKRLATTVLFIFCGGSLFIAAGQKVNSVASRKTPETVIKNFYSWYIDALNKNLDPLSRNHRTKLKQFVSARFIAEVEDMIRKNEYDADAFIAGQDWDKNWGENITVSKLTANKNKASANVFLKGKDKGMNHKLRITLLQKNGSWKIDNVVALDI